MESRLEQVLDECIRRIASEGATVEECLARYPQHASELEPHLRLAAQMASALSQTPSAAAVERARERLRAELRTHQARDQARAARRWSWRLPTLTGAWRLAAASAAVVVALLFAGTSVVAASGSAIPGNALYPVKRAAEDARLTATFSQEAKANLKLTYVERRSEELARLVESGDASRIPTAQEDLGRELEVVRAAFNTLPDRDTVAQLRDRLQESSDVQLARLQSAVQKAPAAASVAAGDSFQQASAAYGNAVEAALSKSPPQYAYAQPGAIQLRVTDPPPPGVEKAIVTVEQVEAHRVAGQERGWVPLFVAPQSFDLLQVSDVQKLLGQVQVEPGTYTRLRFLVSSATVVVNGVEHQARVPSERMSFTRPFTVEEGQTTVVTLDFDGARSLRALGQGQFLITPVVQVLARRLGAPTVAPTKEKTPAEKERPAAPGQEKKAPATPSIAKEAEREKRPTAPLEIEGPVQSLSEGEIVVRGQPISIPEGSTAQADIKKDQRIVVVARERPDGSLVAVEIKEPPRDREKPERDKPAASKEEVRAEPVEVTGVLRAMEGDVWLVGERRLHVGPEAKVNGTPSIGALVVAKGIPRGDGGVDAQQIVVVQPPPRVEPTPTPGGARKPPAATATPSSGQERPGQTDKLTPEKRATPTQERKTPAPPGRIVPTSTPASNQKGRSPLATPSRPANAGNDEGTSDRPDR